MIRASVVGIGKFGSLYANKIADRPDYDLVNIVDSHPRAHTMTNHDVPVYDRLGPALLEGIDVVISCVPASASHEIAIETLESGSHLLLSKPGATNLTEAAEIARAAYESDYSLSLDYTPRNTSAWRYLRDEVLQEPTGAICRRITAKQPRHAVGALLDLAPHDIALLCDLTRNVLRVTEVAQSVDGSTTMLSITDDRLLTAAVYAQHGGSNPDRVMIIGDQNTEIVWDQINSIVTHRRGQYIEVVEKIDHRDALDTQLDIVAERVEYGGEDDTDLFIRVMAVLEQAASPWS